VEKQTDKHTNPAKKPTPRLPSAWVITVKVDGVRRFAIAHSTGRQPCDQFKRLLITSLFGN